MRFYGFKADELTETQSPDLDPTLDPKLAWALRHRGFFPIDVNAAPREALWRIPGIGVRNVERILAARRVQRLGLAELKRLRVAVRRARPFIIASDHHPDAKLLDGPALRRRVAPAAPEQLSLFSSAQLSRTGEL
jgi:predicted DNA-binding helix-hairpin-helix protein